MIDQTINTINENVVTHLSGFKGKFDLRACSVAEPAVPSKRGVNLIDEEDDMIMPTMKKQTMLGGATFAYGNAPMFLESKQPSTSSFPLSPCLSSNNNIVIKSEDDEDLPPLKAEDEAKLTPEELQRRKAERRRLQVRNASRRCRKRQKDEVLELRLKVYEMDKLIAQMKQNYEWELNQHKQQINDLTKQNALLSEKIRLATNMNQHVPTSTTPSSMVIGLPLSGTDQSTGNTNMIPYMYTPQQSTSLLSSCHSSTPTSLNTRALLNQAWNATYDRHIFEIAIKGESDLLKLLNSVPSLCMSMKTFGWQVNLWSNVSQYYARTKKFFPGLKAMDVAKRFYTYDVKKYQQSFPEIKTKETLKFLNEKIKIVRTVKQFLDQPDEESISVDFFLFSSDQNTIVVGSRHIDLPYGPRDPKLIQVKECNGYIFKSAKEFVNGKVVSGTLIQGIGRFDCSTQLTSTELVDRLAKAFASVFIRWESLFVNDFLIDDDEGEEEQQQHHDQFIHTVENGAQDNNNNNEEEDDPSIVVHVVSPQEEQEIDQVFLEPLALTKEDTEELVDLL